MSDTELDHLVRKYYGYVADLEGSGVELLDLLFTRDKIQTILNRLSPEEVLPVHLYEHIYELDALLWSERRTFLVVLGEQELRHARQQQGSPRSHWWWYVDELKAQPEPVQAQRQRLAQSFTPARG
jgi:hypothetical protein